MADLNNAAETSCNNTQVQEQEEPQEPLPEPEPQEPQEDNNEEMEVVTMVDVLNEERELEEDANAVLGGSDEKNCTYSKGYLKRQALYACVTCIPESKTDPSKRAGVCLACSYSCHENHELIELYTKRNFRCDCGNGKFGEKKCNLEPEKDPRNDLNIYNNNFSGLYCNCERPYPDPEDNTVDDMIQCIVCEDWYHCRHLGGWVPPMNSYSEMICPNCVTNNDFILNYSGLAISKPVDEEPILPKIVKVENETESIEVAVAEETPNSSLVEESTTGTSTSGNECKRPKMKPTLKGALFWPDNWRLSLCSCPDCISLYESQKIGYLIDIQDTVHVYEEKGKAKALENSENSESQYEQGMKALSSLDRIKQVEVVSEYNAMKDQLKEYLQKVC